MKLKSCFIAIFPGGHECNSTFSCSFDTDTVLLVQMTKVGQLGMNDHMSANVKV